VTFRAAVVGPYRRRVPADGATLMTDDTFRPDGTRPGALICHPAGQGHDQQVIAEWWPVPRALAESGVLVCLACDLGDPSVEEGPTSASYSWGNANAQACLTEAYRFLVGPAVRARPGRVLLAGTSMGALLALNWARHHRDLVAGMLLGCPVLDLLAAAHGPLSATVLAAYGVRRPEELVQLSAHSPVTWAPRLAGVPIRIYSSRDDPLASDTAACEAFAELVGGTGIDVVDLGPAGHWPVGTPVDDALRFAATVVAS
jgi:predicted alpha/beta hydrolase family esterase